MPYYFDIREAPEVDNNDLSTFLEVWNDLENDLLNTFFETKEDAIVEKNRKTEIIVDIGILTGVWSVIEKPMTARCSYTSMNSV